MAESTEKIVAEMKSLAILSSNWEKTLTATVTLAVNTGVCAIATQRQGPELYQGFARCAGDHIQAAAVAQSQISLIEQSCATLPRTVEELGSFLASGESRMDRMIDSRFSTVSRTFEKCYQAIKETIEKFTLHSQSLDAFRSLSSTRLDSTAQETISKLSTDANVILSFLKALDETIRYAGDTLCEDARTKAQAVFNKPGDPESRKEAFISLFALRAASAVIRDAAAAWSESSLQSSVQGNQILEQVIMTLQGQDDVRAETKVHQLQSWKSSATDRSAEIGKKAQQKSIELRTRELERSMKNFSSSR